MKKGMEFMGPVENITVLYNNYHELKYRHNQILDEINRILEANEKLGKRPDSKELDDIKKKFEMVKELHKKIEEILKKIDENK